MTVDTFSPQQSTPETLLKSFPLDHVDRVYNIDARLARLREALAARTQAQRKDFDEFTKSFHFSYEPSHHEGLRRWSLAEITPMLSCAAPGTQGDAAPRLPQKLQADTGLTRDVHPAGRRKGLFGDDSSEDMSVDDLSKHFDAIAAFSEDREEPADLPANLPADLPANLPANSPADLPLSSGCPVARVEAEGLIEGAVGEAVHEILSEVIKEESSASLLDHQSAPSVASSLDRQSDKGEDHEADESFTDEQLGIETRDPATSPWDANEDDEVQAGLPAAAASDPAELNEQRENKEENSEDESEDNNQDQNSTFVECLNSFKLNSSLIEGARAEDSENEEVTMPTVEGDRLGNSLLEQASSQFFINDLSLSLATPPAGPVALRHDQTTQTDPSEDSVAESNITVVIEGNANVQVVKKPTC